jgi:hypothetical protein
LGTAKCFPDNGKDRVLVLITGFGVLLHDVRSTEPGGNAQGGRTVTGPAPLVSIPVT